MSSGDRETWENDLTGAYEWLASVPTWVIVLAMILGIAVAAFRALLPSWGRRAAGLLLLVALVGCELPTATPEQETPEQAQAVAGPGYCVMYHVPPREYDPVDSGAVCSDGSQAAPIGIVRPRYQGKTCEESLFIPPTAKQIYGCYRRVLGPAIPL